MFKMLRPFVHGSDTSKDVARSRLKHCSVEPYRKTVYFLRFENQVLGFNVHSDIDLDIVCTLD